MERRDAGEAFQSLSRPDSVRAEACSRCRDLFYVQGEVGNEPICSACRRIARMEAILGEIRDILLESVTKP
jgi:hypothetical protein